MEYSGEEKREPYIGLDEFSPEASSAEARELEGREKLVRSHDDDLNPVAWLI